MNKHLVWFRNDLRVSDNPALHQALQSADHVTAIYIHTPQQDREQHHRGERQQAFIDANLACLQQALASIDIDLQITECASYAEVPALLQREVETRQISALFANREPGVNENQRDVAVRETTAIPFHRGKGDCVFAYGAITNQQGAMFRVFTPFRNAWLKHLAQHGYGCLPAPIDAWPDPPAGAQAVGEFIAGEPAAAQALHEFVAERCSDYADTRDYPRLPGTSKLSPYLAIGVLSPRQCLQAVESHLGYLPVSQGEQGFAWLNELVWREFYRHLMVAFPGVSKSRSFKPDMDRLAWVNDPGHFAAWCEGRTGYPIVDAAMRCLNQTGWMHNRLRMIVASFLTKDLQVDWRWGEKYFMQQLIDADFASNNGGWQWAAGTGADAAPYFRIFNPARQSEKFDGDGEFIRQWVPELQTVPTKQVHQPHAWLQQHDPDSTYPAPVVDHSVARDQTLARYQALKDEQP